MFTAARIHPLQMDFIANGKNKAEYYVQPPALEVQVVN